MMYLTVILIPPVYFLMRKRGGAFVLNSILYGFACLFLITFIFAGVAPVFWMLAVGHAGWHLRKEMISEHAEMIATKMADKLIKAKAAGEF